MSTKEHDYKIYLLTDEEDLNPDDDNVDIEVEFDSGERYVATLFTLKNIPSLMKRYESTHECHNGGYFWASDMIVVQKLTKKNIQDTVVDLSHELKHAFAG